jgi:hypothetical protein
MPVRLTVIATRSLLDRERRKRLLTAAVLPFNRLRVLVVLGVVLLGALSLAAPAFAVDTALKAASATTAESSSTDPGLNLVTWLSGWVGGLFAIGVGGAGIAVAARRHVGEGLALLLVALMVGGFVVDPSDMQTLTTAIWHKIATGA